MGRMRNRRPTDRCQPEVPHMAHIERREIHRDRDARHAYLDGVAPQSGSLRAPALSLTQAIALRSTMDVNNSEIPTSADGGVNGTGSSGTRYRLQVFSLQDPDLSHGTGIFLIGTLHNHVLTQDAGP